MIRSKENKYLLLLGEAVYKKSKMFQKAVILNQNFRTIIKIENTWGRNGNFSANTKSIIKKYNIPYENCYSFKTIKELKEFIRLKNKYGVKYIIYKKERTNLKMKGKTK